MTAAAALRASVREPEAFVDFYRAHVDSIFVYIAKRVYEPEIALDLAAETFAQAYCNRGDFRGSTDAEAAGWIYRIASRQVSRYFRRRKVELRAIKRLGLERPSLDDKDLARVEELSELALIRGAVRAELAVLPLGQQEALKLRIVEELPYAQVAQRLGITERAARNRVMRGLRSLAASLDRSSRLEESGT